MGLAAAGVITVPVLMQAEEKPMSQVLTAVSATTLSGYVDTSFIWKTGPQGDVLPGRFNDGANYLNQFNLDVVGLTLEKPLSEDQWAAGYRVDLLAGPNAVYYNPSANGSSMSDFAVKQAYVNLRMPVGNGLDFKAGVFNTIIGYEVFESYMNPNFGRSYGWLLEPTQHTGLLMSYQISEGFSASVGLANTSSAGINAYPYRNQTQSDWVKTFLASLNFAAPESWGALAGSTFSAGVITGMAGDLNNNIEDGQSNSKKTVNYYIGGTLHTPVEGLAVGMAFDYRENGYNLVTFGDNWAWAAAGYLSFSASEKLKFNLRGDFTSGSNGTFFDSTAYGYGDSANKLMAITATADYALWANVISRLELRWDHDLSGDGVYNSVSDPMVNVFTIAANVVYKF
jgi:hypothetical protein